MHPDDKLHAVVRDVGPNDLEALGMLYGELFSDRPEDTARWLADVPVPAMVRRIVVAGREIVAHLADVGMATWVEGERRTVSTGMHWIVHPNARGTGVGQLLFSDARAYREMDAMLGFPTALGAQKMAGSGHHSVLEPLEQWYSWRQPAAFSSSRMSRVPAPVVRAGLAVAAGAARVGRRVGLEILDGAPPDSELDELAARSASFARCIRVRDAAFLRWRWRALGPVRMAAARDRHGRLRGWVAYRDAGAVGVARILDVLADAPHALRALVSHAGDRVAEHGAELVDLRFRDPRPWARAALVAAGYLPRGNHRDVVVRSHEPTVRDTVSRAGAWYMTSADTDAP